MSMVSPAATTARKHNSWSWNNVDIDTHCGGQIGVDSELEEKEVDAGRNTNKGVIKIVQAWGL